MKRFRPLLPAIVLALAACSSTSYTVSDFWAILPDVVRQTDADAHHNARGQAPEGPVWIDVNSFAGGGWQLTGTTLNRDSVMARVGYPPAQRVDQPQQAIVIQDTGTVAASPEAVAGLTGGRYVRGYGVLLHMNQVKADNQEIAATITSYTTDRHVWPTGICRRVIRLTYRRDAQGKWRPAKLEQRKGCDDPD